MTSLTTIMGLLPMVIVADQTGLWYALALATIGGMTTSTLLVLPALCALGSSRINDYSNVPLKNSNAKEK